MSKRLRQQAAQEEYRRLLREKGLKATTSRLDVLAFLEKLGRPASAQDVIGRMKKECDPATVYRIFKELKEKGIIRPVDLRHNHAHYELVDEEHHHHHLACVCCGRVEDISGCDIGEMYKTVLKTAKSFAEIRDHSLEFYGLCAACAKKWPSSPPRRA